MPDIKEILTNYKKLNNQSELKIDSRKLSPNDVFFAMKGHHFDGNKFINDAIAKQVGLIVSENLTNNINGSKSTTRTELKKSQNKTNKSKISIQNDDQFGSIRDQTSKQQGKTNQLKTYLRNEPKKSSIENDPSKFQDNTSQSKRLTQLEEIKSIKENNNTKLDPEIIIVEDIQTTIQDAIDIFYPSIPEHLLVVTGTNGKTSVVTYIQQLVAMLGRPSASIGTNGVQVSLTQKEMTPALQDVVNNPIPLTTPQLVDLRRELHHMATNNIHHIAFEASSHGIHQKRIGDLKAHCAGFTSFSQDHLDYHKDMDTYLAVKLSLFKNNLKNDGTVVINSEANEISKIKLFLDDNQINYVTVGKNGDLNIQKITSTLTHQTVEFLYQNKSYSFQTDILGSYQITNILIAVMMVHLSGFNFDSIIPKLRKLTAPKCRLERITSENHPFHIFIDFAHTPDAMEKALGELAKVKQEGKLKVVFGASGNRDTGKRLLMGQVASKYADEAIVTEDNDRFEDGDKIREQIVSGMNTNECTILNIPNRIRAIEVVMVGLKEGDILLLCGKGSENYFDNKGVKQPYVGDEQLARKLLQK